MLELFGPAAMTEEYNFIVADFSSRVTDWTDRAACETPSRKKLIRCEQDENLLMRRWLRYALLEIVLLLEKIKSIAHPYWDGIVLKRAANYFVLIAQLLNRQLDLALRSSNNEKRVSNVGRNRKSKSTAF
jgi:hypothetical protein